MKIFYDAEFFENGETIKLISLGMVREDGKELYLINSNLVVLREAYKNDWIRKNVIRHLPALVWPGDDPEDPEQLNWNCAHPDFKKIFFPHGQFGIKEQVKNFIRDTPNPELWAWYGAYDHVVYAQLFGRMIDLPAGFPMFTHELKQLVDTDPGFILPEQAVGAHNALADARWDKEVYDAFQARQKALQSRSTANPERTRVW